MQRIIILTILLVTLSTTALGNGGLITNDNVKFRITQLEFRVHVMEQQIDALNDIISGYERVLRKHGK